MKTFSVLVLLALAAGCSSAPSALPMPVGDYRPVNRAATNTPIPNLDTPASINDLVK